VGGPPPKVVLPTRRKTPVNRASVGVAILFFGSDAQGFHLPIEMAALQTQRLGGPAHVPVILIQFFQSQLFKKRYNCKRYFRITLVTSSIGWMFVTVGLVYSLMLILFTQGVVPTMH
jgi:hypothetical protein